MKLPFASMFVLKFFLLSLLSITTNAKVVNNKLLSEICRKTKSPEKCLIILGANRKTRLASSLHGLGLDSLTLAISRARMAANTFNAYLLRGKNVPWIEKNILKECRENYLVAAKSLGNAKTEWNEKKYRLAVKSIERAHNIPISCEKAIGAPPLMGEVRRVNKIADITFDIALAVAKEMEANGNKSEDAYII